MKRVLLSLALGYLALGLITRLREAAGGLHVRLRPGLLVQETSPELVSLGLPSISSQPTSGGVEAESVRGLT
jgi:hypothetical protein